MAETRCVDRLQLLPAQPGGGVPERVDRAVLHHPHRPGLEAAGLGAVAAAAAPDRHEALLDRVFGRGGITADRVGDAHRPHRMTCVELREGSGVVSLDSGHQAAVALDRQTAHVRVRDCAYVTA